VARVIPDEQPVIEATLKDWCEQGGLLPDRDDRRHRPGPAGRDAGGDEAVCERILDGFGEQMRCGVAAGGADRHPIAADRGDARQDVDRQPAGQAERHPRVSPGGVPGIPYCIDLMEGPYLTTNEAVGEGVPAEKVGARRDHGERATTVPPAGALEPIPNRQLPSTSTTAKADDQGTRPQPVSHSCPK